MVNVFGDSAVSRPGNLQVVKRVVVRVSLKPIGMKYSKATSLDLHLIDYTRIQMVHLSPPFVMMMKRYVLDDVATMEVGDRDLATDTINSELVMGVVVLHCKDTEEPLGQEV